MSTTPWCNDPKSGNRLSYAQLQKLPTDPQQTLPYPRRLMPGWATPDSPGQSGADAQKDFKMAADMFVMYPPRAQRAATLRAIKAIPGVEFVEQAKDAAGRDGVAVSMIDDAKDCEPS